MDHKQTELVWNENNRHLTTFLCWSPSTIEVTQHLFLPVVVPIIACVALRVILCFLYFTHCCLRYSVGLENLSLSVYVLVDNSKHLLFLLFHSCSHHSTEPLNDRYMSTMLSRDIYFECKKYPHVQCLGMMDWKRRKKYLCRMCN